MLRSLDSARIAETAERLGKRVTERFPGSGPSGVAELWLKIDILERVSPVAQGNARQA